MDPEPLEAAITPRTRAIVPVHSTDSRWTRPDPRHRARHGIPVVEDGAQAHGAEDRAAARRHGDAVALSFYPGKNLGGAAKAAR